MAFPTSPIDGELYDSGTATYVFDAATNSWLRSLVTQSYVDTGDAGGGTSTNQLNQELCDFELFAATATFPLTDSIHTLKGCIILWKDGDYIQWI